MSAAAVPAPSVEELMAVVRSSPATVAAHDKQGWLDLFAFHHIVEDPVGSRPVLGGLYDRRSRGRGNAPLSRFWDTFIGHNDVAFEVHHDFVRGWQVVRDVTIRTTMQGGIVVTTPAHLRYELVPVDGQVRVRRMAAHWEVAPVFAQLIRPGSVYVQAMVMSNRKMFTHLGLGGTLAFLASMFSVGRSGKRVVTDLVAAAARGELQAIRLLGGAVPTALTKVIASGDAVTANCVVDGAPAVLMVYLNRGTREIVSCDLYR